MRWQVLRKFPTEAYESCRNKDGSYNTYPTTINALLSGMRKLMWVAPVPHDRFVYRGLGGANLPDKFFEQDEFGVRGGTEFGMLSTSRSMDVAIQYAGDKKMPTVFKIGIGAVNRGALLDDFSQYPSEKEVLFPPLSFLEVVGEISYMTLPTGKVVRVVPLEIIANLNSPLLEELIGMRKKLYIDSFEHQAHNLERELWDLIKATKDQDDSIYFCNEVPFEEQKEVVSGIIKQFDAVLDQQKNRPAKWYNDDGRYRSAVIEMLSVKENAMAVPFLSRVMYGEWKSKMKQLRQANRMVSKEKSKALRVAFSDGGQRRSAAFVLCKAQGIVAEQLEERNEMSETPLIREAADGDSRHVEWLLEAGADVHAQMKNEIGFLALNQAAYFGNTNCIKQLLRFDADPKARDKAGGTPLVAAALNGELECIKVLLEVGDGLFFEDRDDDGTIRKTAYIDQATHPNMSTPLMKAAVGGHVACVRVLIVAGADATLENKDGKTAADQVEAKIQELTKQEKVLQEKDPKNAIDISQHEKCLEILKLTPDQIREQDNAEIMEMDRSRMDTHVKAFENQALGLRREIRDLIADTKYRSQFETKDALERDQVVELVVNQFQRVLNKHKKRRPKWYNDDGKYRSAVSEMLNMKENARAVPLLTPTMYKEWTSKQQFLRQASRMVYKEQNRELREKAPGSAERQNAALQLCRAAGTVTEYLEERNEMSETVCRCPFPPPPLPPP